MLAAGFWVFALQGSLITADAANQETTGKQKSSQKNSKKKKPAPFKWVNPLPKNVNIPGLRHATFVSPSMNQKVGYCIYLPTEYQSKTDDRFPVVYYLHGGRPGSETKSVSLCRDIHKVIESKDARPMIYVFVNGGAVSHYNYPDKNSMGEDVFVRELIPHIDRTYRTIADRSGRGLEGFSQGGRGTARIMFQYPQLFVSAAPGGGGFATEKRISESDGRESESLKFLPGHNAYDRARKYAKNQTPKLNILIHVGTKGFNYENNLEYMKFLNSLGIEHRKLIVEGVPHSAKKIYEKKAKELVQFHAGNFANAKSRK